MPEPSLSGPRRRSLALLGAAVMITAVIALPVAILRAQRSSGMTLPAPIAVPSTTTTSATTASTTTTAPSPAPPPAPTPTTAAATPAQPPPAPKVVAAAPNPPRPPAPPRLAAAAPAPVNPLDEVQSIADSSGWNWRKVHVQFRIGFDPADCCHWGIYDPTDHKTIWIGPTAFDDPVRLRYVVLHELAHAWQWHSHRLNLLEADMAPWGYSGMDALEAGADCVATVWGANASSGHYWTCPPPAQAVVARRLAGDWSKGP